MILITGATGFVGSHLVRRLVADGHRVRILRRATAQLDILGNVPYEDCVGDLADPTAVDRAVAGCDVVFHSGAIIQYWDDQNAYQTLVNVAGTRHVVEACLRYKISRLIHVSSVSAVGFCADGALADESTVYNIGPIRLHYADTKYQAERVVLDGVRRGLDAVMINPGTIYGPGDHRRANYLRGLAGPITAAGGMSVVDVADVVEGAIQAWQRGKTGERYILSADNLSYQEVGKIFAALVGRRGPNLVVPKWLIILVANIAAPFRFVLGRQWALTPTMARAAHIRFFFSNAKAKKELGMQFRPFAATAKQSVEWMKEHGYVS